MLTEGWVNSKSQTRQKIYVRVIMIVLFGFCLVNNRFISGQGQVKVGLVASEAELKIPLIPKLLRTAIRKHLITPKILY